MKEKFAAVLKYCGKELGYFESVITLSRGESECWSGNQYNNRIKIGYIHGTLSCGKLCLSGFVEKLFERHKLSMLDSSKFELEIPAENCSLNHLRFENLIYEKHYDDPERETPTICIESVKFSGQIVGRV